MYFLWNHYPEVSLTQLYARLYADLLNHYFVGELCCGVGVEYSMQLFKPQAYQELLFGHLLRFSLGDVVIAFD